MLSQFMRAILLLGVVVALVAVVLVVVGRFRAQSPPETIADGAASEADEADEASVSLATNQNEEVPTSLVSEGGGGGPRLAKWEGVREAVDACYAGVAKFTVSFVPPGVWIGGKIGNYTLTGSYDSAGQRVNSVPFGNSKERAYETLACSGRTACSCTNVCFPCRRGRRAPCSARGARRR